jgi:hypothetical protein
LENRSSHPDRPGSPKITAWLVETFMQTSVGVAGFWLDLYTHRPFPGDDRLPVSLVAAID